MSKRKLGIFLASLVAGVCAFAAVILPFTGKTTASAEGTYDASQLITLADGVGIVQAGHTGSGSTAHKGILVTPTDTTAKYSGSINGTFKGDTRVDFSFPGTHDGGHFVFTISAADDPSKSFNIGLIKYNNFAFNSVGYVEYDGKYYQYNGSAYTGGNYQYDRTGYPALGQDEYVYTTDKSKPSYQAGYTGAVDSYFFLDYDDEGILNVKMIRVANNQSVPQEVTLAKFDGAEAFAAGSTWGLPEMPFNKGYKISFSSVLETKTLATTTKIRSFKLEGITTGGTEYVFDTETLTAEPAFVSADYSESITMSLPDYKSVYIVAELPAVLAPVGTNSAGELADITANTTVTVTKDGVELEKTVGDTLGEVGEYEITYSYDGQILKATFSVYEDYANIKDTPVTIKVNGEYPSGALVGDSILVYGGTFTYDAEEYATIPAQTVAGVKVNGVAVSGLYTFEKADTYTLTYEAIADNAEVESNVKEYVIVVTESGFKAANLISLSGGNATVVGGHIGAGSSVHNGVLVTPIDTQTSYEGAINGTFRGDTRVDFSFPGETTMTPNKAGYAGANGHFIFRVEDASNPDVFFEIGMIRNKFVSSNHNGTSLYVRYDGKDYTYYNGNKDVQFRYDVVNGPVFGMDNYKYDNSDWYNGEKAGQDIESYFKLDYDENGVLSVKMLIAKYRNRVDDEAKFEEIVLAVFDGVPFTKDATAEKPVYHTLPLMPFESGYKISFRSVLDVKTQCTPDTIVPFKLEKITTNDGTVTDLSAAILSEAPVWALDGGSTPDTATINSVALRIDGSLNLMLDATAAEGYTIDAVKALYRDNEYTLSADDSGKYIFSEITPQYLDEKVVFSVVAGGKTINREYSIAQYLAYLKETYADDAKTMAVVEALENYGEAAKAYLGFEGATAPELASVDQSAIENKKGLTEYEGKAVAIKSANLYFDSTVGIGVKFDVGENSIEGMRVHITVNGKSYYIASEHFTLVEGTTYSVTFMNVSATDFDDMITVKVQDAESATVSGIATYSINSYAASVKDTASDFNLAMAVYLYGQAVNAYANAQ